MTEPTLAPPRSDEVLPPGTKLGPYEIEGLIGSGGMGHVYRARDPRLGRRVAIKTLAESAAAVGSEGVRRFETEARAAGTLDHPNLLIVYDVGREANISYIVSELLEGETLRDRLGRQGALPERQAIDYALQAARGLAAAHSRGIVHRDLKPENLFITRDRGMKILDFGVAKLLPGAEMQHENASGHAMTVAGMVVGTVGYMAPEQVNGQPVDHRADLFSLGVVMHEMLAGSAPFRRTTPVASMNAIATEEPPELPDSVSAGMAAVVQRCLEKSREDRFASANDLIVALDVLAATSRSGSSTSRQRVRGGVTRRQSLRLGAVAAAAALAAGVGGGVALDRVLRPESLLASFRRLTFRRGLIRSARFAPDGQTILYGALWEGGRCRVHGVRLDGPESSALDLPDANLLAVSRSGELALALGSHLSGIVTYGTLARVPMAGGVPRELTERVKFADWSPDGAELAVVRRVEGRDLLEYPAGKVLVRSPAGEGSGLGFARVAPDGKQVAYVQYRSPESLLGRVCVVDADGRCTELTGEYLNIHGLAWKGEEIWYTAADQQPLFRALCAVRPGRPPRTITRVPGNVTLWDISPQGRLVLAHTDDRGAMFVQREGEAMAQDLSWLDASSLADLSRDGRLVLFTEDGQGGGSESSVYLRRTDGSAAVRLGSGRALALSPDTRWALCAPGFAGVRQLELVPTGAGQMRRLPDSGLDVIAARWLLDGKCFVAEAIEPGRRARLVQLDVDGTPPRDIAPEGVWNWALSPDATAIAVRGPEPVTRLYPVAGGEARTLPGDGAGETIVGWIEAGLLVMRPSDTASKPGAVFLVDVESGERRAFGNLLPQDGAGIMALVAYCATPDGGTQAYAWHRALSNLYVAEGLA